MLDFAVTTGSNRLLSPRHVLQQLCGFAFDFGVLKVVSLFALKQISSGVLARLSGLVGAERRYHRTQVTES